MEITAAVLRDGDWQNEDSGPLPFGKPNWRSPAWPATRPMQANYRCLGNV